jgi:LPS sulfotransferase NodH
MSNTRFVILAAPRTGSNYLCTLLNSHPEILCHHELFNPRGIFYALDYRDGSIDLGSVADRDRRPLEFLQDVWLAGAGSTCTGFKMTRDQHDIVIRHLLEDAAVLKIVLRRSNRLKTFVSQLIAEQTDRWEAYDRADLPRDVAKVRVDVASLKANVARNQRFYETILLPLRSRRQRFIEMMYEELHSRSEHHRLLTFLGVKAIHEPLSSSSVKQNPRDLRAVIANYAEVESELQGSEYADELHDVLT